MARMVKKNPQKTVIILNKIYINYSEILLPMKKTGLLIIFFVLLSVFASANTVEENLYEKNSLEVPGYNITLLSIANDEKSIVICINNEKKILNKKSRLILENLKIEPTYIYEKYANVGTAAGSAFFTPLVSYGSSRTYASCFCGRVIPFLSGHIDSVFFMAHVCICTAFVC